MDLYMKEREGKPNADCQSQSPMPSTSAESSSSRLGQARPMGAGEAGVGRRGWWGQARPMGAASDRPHARARQHRALGKPSGQIPSQQFIPWYHGNQPPRLVPLYQLQKRRPKAILWEFILRLPNHQHPLLYNNRYYKWRLQEAFLTRPKWRTLMRPNPQLNRK